MTHNQDEYEKELRKLVHCEDDPAHPVTAYGRERGRIRKIIQTSLPSPSDYISPKERLPFVLAYKLEQSEFLIDTSGAGYYYPLFGNSSQSERLLRYMVDEIFYRAAELMAVQHFNEAREALGYKGDRDGRIYEMYVHTKNQTTREWAPEIDILWRRERRAEIVDGISLAIARYACFLFFGGMQEIQAPGMFERWFDSSDYLTSLGKEVTRLFPEAGYTALNIEHAGAFAAAYDLFLGQTNSHSANINYPYMPNIYLINPHIKDIAQQHINFRKLTSDTVRLQMYLSRCLKRNGLKYANVAARLKETTDRDEADKQPEASLSERPQPGATDETRQLKEEMGRMEAEIKALRERVKEQDNQEKELNRMHLEADLLRNEVKACNEQVEQLQCELETQHAQYAQRIQAQEKHIKKLQALMAEQQEQAAAAMEEKEELIAEQKTQIQRLKERLESMWEDLFKTKEKCSNQRPLKTDGELLDRITSCLIRYENNLYDSDMASHWKQTEMSLTYIFNKIPEIIKIIQQIQEDRSRIQKEQQKETAGNNATIYIKENNGPVLNNLRNEGPLKRLEE